MTIIRRSDQEESTPFEGGKMLLLAGAPTGASMATVGDLTVEPGTKTVYHFHPNTEESIFVVAGELEFRIGTTRFRASSGDCVLAQQGVGHGLENVGDYPARVITIYPTAQPQREALGEVEYTDGDPGPTVTVRGDVEPYEFFAGITRYDMVGDFLGASSTYLSELTFEAGSVAPNHYHPSHEESMFCLEGDLVAVYADDNNVPLSAGDCFTCEVGVRHGIYNASSAPAKLLAIHPVLNPPPRVDVN
ncbi:MAG: cupin domain-containing protein [Chloroflexi bacterium]|nr:cupin domain-containing protein [Chloroflexota bacterium]MCI0774571.1 cupin domain-containing protein [Chloroflexota bacterium]MCI0804330.1 cupin domain-containing protein [Chloroflexota bacterium]MCI0809435.1 cupin domain-containing protein [Chloroflexota bacterium]MCI0837320.1 cupin domain-containing protein [Chloroflexota bacterium]